MERDVYISDNELAERLGVERSSVDRMIRKYMDDLTEYGNVLIEKGPPKVGGPEKYYLLTTKWQYYLLVMYASPTGEACEEKVAMVRSLFSTLGKE
ncbi:hypothetical protein ABQD95_04310 [Enterococcus avium]|uniref:hypothetical protein n=1 Tax=Enterococcus avium TaxID=33945 RepID=UPI0028904BFA|nr:hypothetical protein [Enterococcus avium]MDT2390954.1 hypothetical protein [Enterococcus avium]